MLRANVNSKDILPSAQTIVAEVDGCTISL